MLSKQGVLNTDALDAALAARGIDGSGIQGALFNQNMMSTSIAQADARFNADQAISDVKINTPLEVAQMKMNFLATGNPMFSGAVQGVGNAYSNAASLATQRALAQGGWDMQRYSIDKNYDMNMQQLKFQKNYAADQSMGAMFGTLANIGLALL